MALNDSLRADLIKELQETVEDDSKEDIRKRYDPQTNTLYGENAGDAYTNDEIREGVMFYKYQKEKVASTKNEAYYYEMAAYALDSVYKQRKEFNIVDANNIEDINWLRIDRLPVSPLRIDDYDLLSRWQGVLSSLHAWNQKMIFLLQRFNGETHLYVGVQGINADDSANKCKCALVSSMPGVDLHILNGAEDVKEIMSINKQINNCACGGAVTGIPSFRGKTQYGVLQTLDKLAFGFKDTRGIDANYSFIVISCNSITYFLSN